MPQCKISISYTAQPNIILFISPSIQPFYSAIREKSAAVHFRLIDSWKRSRKVKDESDKRSDVGEGANQSNEYVELKLKRMENKWS